MTGALRWRQWLPEFVLLGVIWGSSFLFMRMTSQEFGSWSTAWLRVSVAWLTLLPFLLWQGQAHSLGLHWKRVLPLGVVNSGIPTPQTCVVMARSRDCEELSLRSLTVTARSKATKQSRDCFSPTGFAMTARLRKDGKFSQ